MKARTIVLWVILLLAAAATAATGQRFTGSWDAMIVLSPQEAMPFTAFESTLDVGLTFEFLTVASVSDFVIDGWVWEELDLGVDLGLVTFDGAMLFEPQTGSFLYAEGVLSLHVDPITFSIYAAITGETSTEPAYYGFVLDLRADLFGGLFTFESATFLNADLSGITFTASATQTNSSLLTRTFLTDPTIALPPVTFCGEEITFSGMAYDCLELTSVTLFSDLGFESETISLSILRVFGLPLTLSFDIVYEVQTKSYAFTPSLETDFGCLSIYSRLLGNGGLITGLEIYGIAFRASFGGATLTSITNLDTTQYVITTPDFGWFVESLADAMAEGHLYYPQDYWQILSLVVDVPPLGCGFTFSVDTFFSTTDGLLFEWAESTMGISLALGTSVSTGTSITIDSTGFTGWSLSFRVAW
ncbi:MAG: hypothetical protein AB1778_01130 [Candidatus Bipolaricaulota bacterium]